MRKDESETVQKALAKVDINLHMVRCGAEFAAAPEREFDVRIWVLVDADFGVHVWRRGVLRTCSVAFSNDRATFGDPFVHLSNHCVQERCAAYGAQRDALLLTCVRRPKENAG